MFAILDFSQIVDKERLKNMATAVREFSLAIHATVSPLAHIVVAQFDSLVLVFSILCLDWPLVVSNAVHGSV